MSIESSEFNDTSVCSIRVEPGSEDVMKHHDPDWITLAFTIVGKVQFEGTTYEFDEEVVVTAEQNHEEHE